MHLLLLISLGDLSLPRYSVARLNDRTDMAITVYVDIKKLHNTNANITFFFYLYNVLIQLYIVSVKLYRVLIYHVNQKKCVLCIYIKHSTTFYTLEFHIC